MTKDRQRNKNLGKGVRKKTELTDKEEHYSQLRASGYNKSKAAAIAYDTKNPGKMGWEVEQQDLVKARIRQLKDEYAEAFGISYEEQVRKYHELYIEAREQGNLKIAMDVLARIDTLGGFDIKRSETTKRTIGENLKDKDGDVSKDLNKFGTLLGTHEETVKEATKGIPKDDTTIN